MNGVADGSSRPEMAAITWFAIVSVDNLADGNPGIATKDHAVVTGPVYGTDGALLANDLADMWDGTIAVFLNLDESGGTVPGTNLVWTGDASSYSSPGVPGSYEWSLDMAK